jgi:hypothetical protein
MSYTKINVVTELRKVSRGKKSKVDPHVLLRLIADEHLQMLKSK